MTAVQAEKDETWLLKEDAAKYLGTTIRTVERYARKGLLNTRYLTKLPSETQARVVYDRSDLTKLLEGPPAAMDAITKRPTESTSLAVVRSGEYQADAWGKLSTLLAGLCGLQEKYGPPQTKAWLTLEEAVNYSGLPRPEMERLLRMGLIYSFGRGAKTWRVQRAALDAYGTAAHQ